MKKILLYSFALLTTFAIFSCSDKNDYSSTAENDRLMRPIFRTNLTVANGSNDPYLCKCVGRNSIQLYWSTIQGATGYQIKASTIQGVATGDDTNWNDPAYLVLDTIIKGQDSDQLFLEDLKFSATYRFAIRAISERGDDHNSSWMGLGDLRHWADYVTVPTQDK